MKSVMTANIIIQSVYAICVTVAACYFGRPVILGWYALIPLLTITYKTTERGGTDGKSNV